MSIERQQPSASETSSAGLVWLSLLSVLTGAVIGFVIACFRLLLEHADTFRSGMISHVRQFSFAGAFLVVAIVAIAAAASAWLVRRTRQPAAGSGIPHVEAVMEKTLPVASVLLFPVKFLGGLLAIGGGLALGREGPCVQIGANLAAFWGYTFRLGQDDRLALIAAGAGAGLATAFNAPIAGAVFVLEELVRRFNIRNTIAALGASCSAIAVASLLLGRESDFFVLYQPPISVWSSPLFAGLGLLAGIAGIYYNKTLVYVCALVDGMRRVRPELRALAIGALVGVLAWFSPQMVGGGEDLTQLALSGGLGLSALVLVFGVRFLIGPLSFAAGTPGGLFAPILVLGSSLGLGYGLLCQELCGAAAGDPVVYAIVGMASFFTATVRAPLTGMILIVELTSINNHLLPMLWGCFAAMAIPTLLGSPPIYDSLKQRTLRKAIELHELPTR